MKLSPAQAHWLKWLHARGGSAYIDGHHMYAQGERTKMGSEIAWLQLMVKGCIVAKDQRLVVSDYGLRHLGIEPPLSTLCAICDQIKELHPASHPWTAKQAETKGDGT